MGGTASSYVLGYFSGSISRVCRHVLGSVPSWNVWNALGGEGRMNTCSHFAASFLSAVYSFVPELKDCSLEEINELFQK